MTVDREMAGTGTTFGRCFRTSYSSRETTSWCDKSEVVFKDDVVATGDESLGSSDEILGLIREVLVWAKDVSRRIDVRRKERAGVR